MNLELTDEQREAVIQELSQIIENDRYPISRRITVLKDILAKLRPEPAREPPVTPTAPLRAAEQGAVPATEVSAAASGLIRY